MILSSLITQVRESSRTSSDFITDATIANSIDAAIKWFVGADTFLHKVTHLQLAPVFWTHTSMAFRLTITGGSNALAATDIVITATERQRVDGDQVATDLQAQIRAAGATTATVVWSSTEWLFTIDALDSTAIVVAAPTTITYADCTRVIFGKSDSQSSTEWESAIPEDAAREVALPSDFDRPLAVEWDGRALHEAAFNLFQSPQSAGPPAVYQVFASKYMRIYPVPQSQELFQLTYAYIPQNIRDFSGYQECGFTGKAGTTATGLAATTQYYFKVTEDGTQTEYDITTAADVTFAAVIILMNAETTGSTFSIVDGDLRCTSDSSGTSATVALAAGTTGTDLFATLTGFSAFETAVGMLTTEIDLRDEAEEGVVLYATAIRYEAAANEKRAGYFHARAMDRKKKYKQKIANMNPKMEQPGRGKPRTPNYTVTI